MNYLGHLFLSGDDPLVIVGNFMADAVKGGRLEGFPEKVVKGIRLHRAIDGFTDSHPAQRAGRERVRAYAGRYSGVVMDMFFDHLL
jgi:acyl carrier protein phosphodiesterase